MINFEFFTVSQLREWQHLHPIDPGDPLSNMYVGDFANYSDDEVVAVLALNDGELIGRITLAYSYILVAGQLYRCMVGQRLYVREDFRKKAAGVSILLKVLNLEIPYIAGSVSAAMGKIFDAWNMFHRIDSSSVYSVAMTLPTAVRLARLSIQRLHNNSGPIPFYKPYFLVLREIWSKYRIQSRNKHNLRELSKAEALDRVEKILGMVDFPVQVPWSRDVLLRAINGTDRKCFAWLITIDDGDSHQIFFLCLYLRKSKVSLLRTSDIREIEIAELTEVFPPLQNEETGRSILEFIVGKAGQLNVDLLHVHATTRAMETACKKCSLESFFSKKIYITPSGLDEDIAEIVSDPKNWWCRAASEVQFDELPDLNRELQQCVKPYLF